MFLGMLHRQLQTIPPMKYVTDYLTQLFNTFSRELGYGFLDTKIRSALSVEMFQEQTTMGTLSKIFKEHRAANLRDYPGDTFETEFWDQFISMTEELDNDGWFWDVYYCLWHLDLAPRNILIYEIPTVLDPRISGILDWDSAVFAPNFMSSEPPMWIWAWNDNGLGHERTADHTPPTEEGRELKSHFKDVAGPEYLRYAYSPAYRLARRLFRFAIDGIGSNEHYREAETMLEEWQAFRNDH